VGGGGVGGGRGWVLGKITCEGEGVIKDGNSQRGGKKFGKMEKGNSSPEGRS